MGAGRWLRTCACRSESFPLALAVLGSSPCAQGLRSVKHLCFIPSICVSLWVAAAWQTAAQQGHVQHRWETGSPNPNHTVLVVLSSKTPARGERDFSMWIGKLCAQGR